MNTRKGWVLTAILAGAGALGLRAAEPAPAFPPLPQIAILQADKAPVVDGVLDDACWAQAEESSVLTDEYSFPVKLQTTFQVAQKDATLYLAIRGRYDEKPARQTNKGATHNGNMWDEEVVEIFLDPDNEDTPGYYQLIVTPFDVTAEFFNRAARDTEKRWTPDYEVKSRWTTNAWTIEYGIPLAAFDQTATLYENFGLNVHRVDAVYWGVATWAPLHSENLHFPHRFGEARGLRGVGVKTNAAGRLRMPELRVNDRVIRAKANPSLVPEKPPALVSGPEVKASGGSAEIGFEVNTPTDVAVWLEDARGERVRHLAAGLLGANPPAPLQKDTLRQVLAWDYKDDVGKKVPAGSYQVKVGVGSQARLDKELDRSEAPRAIHGVAVDPQGAVFTISGAWDEWTEIRKYDRAGKFVSMLMPPPADVPAEKLKGLNIIDYGPDGQVRFGSHRFGATLPHLDLPMPQTLLVNGKGQLIFFGGEYPGGPARLYKINGDGSLPADFIGPRIVDWNWMAWWELHAKRFHFALDPRDGETVYVSGLKSIHRGDTAVAETNPELVAGKRETFHNAVFRVRWAPDAPLEVFAGKPNTHGTAGSDKPGEFFDPQGIAFDNDGHLWVCDRRNNRIQVLNRDGKFLRQFSHTGPYEARISRKTGEAYVLGIVPTNFLYKGKKILSHMSAVELTKYSADAQPKVLARTRLLGMERKELFGVTGMDWGFWSYWWTLALDDSGAQPAVWVVWGAGNVNPGHGSGSAGAKSLARVADLGDKFGEPEVLIGKTPPRFHSRITVGWESDVIPLHTGYLDANAGRAVTEGLPARAGGEKVAARDGRWVVRNANEYLSVYPEAWGTNPAAPSLCSWALTPPAFAEHQPGLAVAPGGDLYVARYYNYRYAEGAPGGIEGPDHHVAIDRYSLDGKLLAQRVVYELSPAACSPAVDLRGNIYVGDNFGRRIGGEFFYERDIAANLPAWMPDYRIGAAEWDRLRAGDKLEAGYQKFVINPLIQRVGAVYKFGPRGGGILWRAAQARHTPAYVAHQPQTNKDGRVMFADWHYPCTPAPKRPATHWSSAVTAKNSQSEHGMYPCWTEGVEWEFLGASPVPGRFSKTRESSLAGGLRFCVDDFGRLYLPAAHRNTVRLLDTAGNELLRIGSYGNLDSGPGGRLKTPEVPLWYPCAAALSKRYLYIGERYLPRLLRIRMGYCQEKTADLAVP